MSFSWPMKVSYCAAISPYGGTMVNAGFGSVALVAMFGFVERGRRPMSIVMLPLDSEAVTLCRAGRVIPPVRSTW